MYNLSAKTLAALAAITALTPGQALACACGCGIFEVGTSAMLPTQTGGMAFIEYGFMNQNKNWKDTSRAPAANNDDKDIKTNFFTVGAQYMWSRAWGAEIAVPFWQRHFTSLDDDSGAVQSFDHGAPGDIRVRGIYSGFSPDMSTGVTFGFKLPTGDDSYRHFDRDTQIGTGSTDLLLGAYHMGNLAGKFNWFARAQLDQPFLTRAGYRPGSELGAATGVYYNGLSIGGIKIAPLAQLIDSYRLHDRGPASDRENSGYERVLFAPGLELDTGGFKLYADIEIPVYERMKGNQLTAGELFKLSVSRSF